MLRNLTSLEVVIGEKTFRYLCDMDAPLEYCEQALVHFMQYVGKVKEQLLAQQAEQKAAEQPQQESAPQAEEPKAE